MLPEVNGVSSSYPTFSQEIPPFPSEMFNYPSVAQTPPWQSQPPFPGTPQPGWAMPAPTPQKTKPRGRAGAILLLTLVLVLIFGVGLFAGWEFARNGTSGANSSKAATTLSSSSNNATIDTQQESAIARIEPSVVELEVTTAQGGQIGSGVIIDARGDIVTNNHVVSGGQSIDVVLANGTTEKAQMIGVDVANDLAVVRIQPFANMVVAQIGDSSQLVVGQEVLAVGNPLGITGTATRGIVSALNRTVPESNGVSLAHTIQTDAALNPGNSGGALVNLQGQLVGIPTLGAINPESKTTANGISFAIPSNLVQTVVQQILHQ